MNNALLSRKDRFVKASAWLGGLVIILAAGWFLFIKPNNDPPSGPTPPERVTLEGLFTCLPYRDIAPGEPQNADCAAGLRTDDGKIYALDLALSSQLGPTDLFPGDRISGNGVRSAIASGDERRSKYKVDTLFAVTDSFRKVTYDQGGLRYSSAEAAKEIVVDSPRSGQSVTLPLVVTGKVKEGWLSRGQWGPAGTMRMALQDEAGLQVAAEVTASKNGEVDAEGFVPFRGVITLGEHTQATAGYVIIYQSNFDERREYVKIPVRFGQ